MSDGIDTTRRTLLAAATLSTAALVLPEATSAQTGTTAVAAPGLKLLSFDPAKLNGISERLIRSHWENNYGVRSRRSPSSRSNWPRRRR